MKTIKLQRRPKCQKSLIIYIAQFVAVSLCTLRGHMIWGEKTIRNLVETRARDRGQVLIRIPYTKNPAYMGLAIKISNTNPQ